MGAVEITLIAFIGVTSLIAVSSLVSIMRSKRRYSTGKSK
jgi:hypothetical protein